MTQADVNTQYRYNIGDTSIQLSDADQLFIEVGQLHVAAYIHSNETKQIKWCEFKQLNEALSHEQFLGFIARLPFELNTIRKIYIVHNSKDAVLLPTEHHLEHLDQTILETVVGDLFERVVKNDDLLQWEITNVYGIEKYLFDAIGKSIPQAIHIHSNSVHLKAIFKQLSEMHEQWMKVYFYPSSFTVLVIKDEKLQLLQSYYYETPEDVIYQLLNITDQLMLDVTSIFLQVSGLIEEDSTMYVEMRKNFLEISLESTSAVIEEGQHPAPSHYFTPIFLSSTCV